MMVIVVAEQLRRRVPGGIGTYVRGLVQGLGELGDPDVEVSVVRGPLWGPDRTASVARWWDLVPSPVMTRLWDAGIAFGVPRPLGGGMVLHAPSLAMPPTGGACSVTVHDLAWRSVPDTFPPRGRQWHERALARALEHATTLLTPSAVVRERLVTEGARSVVVVPEGSDHLPPPDFRAASALLRRFGVGDGPFVLSVGTVEPRKNLPRVVAAYRQAKGSLPDAWPLVIAGPRGWSGELERVAADADSDVALVGSVPGATLAGLYARARCLVFVPLEEGYGLPPLEAMRAGTPVVASAVPSLEGTDAALVVPSDDVDTIAEALVQAAVDGPLRSALVERGSRLAAERTWKESARQHVAAWRAMLEAMETTA